MQKLFLGKGTSFLCLAGFHRDMGRQSQTAFGHCGAWSGCLVSVLTKVGLTELPHLVLKHFPHLLVGGTKRDRS